MEKVFLPVALFASSVIMTLGLFPALPGAKRLNRGKSAIEMGRKYETGILHLEHPGIANVHNAFLKVLENDEMISKAMSEVRLSLLVYVTNNISGAVTASDMSRYVGETYSRTWDEIVGQRDFDKKCTVLGEGVGGTNVLSLDALVSKHAPDVLYTPSSSHLNINIGNADKSGKSLHVEQYGGEFTKAYLDTDVSYHFLDQAGAALPTYHKVAVGGTFDRIHHGHKKLLTFASILCTEELTVGVSGDALLQNKVGAHLIAPQEKRMAAVEEFIRGFYPSLALNVVPLDDPFGPTVTDGSIEAIVVSSETLMGAKKINQVRRERNFKPLDIIVSRRGEASVMSSTFLRSLET